MSLACLVPLGLAVTTFHGRLSTPLGSARNKGTPVKVEIVGIQNAGKSSLFGALIGVAEAANYRFTTIDDRRSSPTSRWSRWPTHGSTP